MCRNKTLNNKVNHLIIYRDKQNAFRELLEIDSSIEIHARDQRNLMPKIFNVKKGVLFNEVFEFAENL